MHVTVQPRQSGDHSHLRVERFVVPFRLPAGRVRLRVDVRFVDARIVFRFRLCFDFGFTRSGSAALPVSRFHSS